MKVGSLGVELVEELADGAEVQVTPWTLPGARRGSRSGMAWGADDGAVEVHDRDGRRKVLGRFARGLPRLLDLLDARMGYLHVVRAEVPQDVCEFLIRYSPWRYLQASASSWSGRPRSSRSWGPETIVYSLARGFKDRVHNPKPKGASFLNIAHHSPQMRPKLRPQAR